MTDSNSRKPLQHYLDPDYPFLTHPDPDGGYVIVHPALPGYISQAAALDHAPAMAKDARTGWIITEYEEGHSISEPSL